MLSLLKTCPACSCSIEIYSPRLAGVEVHFELSSGEDLKSALDQVEKELKDTLGAIKWEDAVDEDINGMKTKTLEGTAQKEAIHVLLSVIDTPAKNSLCLYYVATKDAEEKNIEAIGEIINGVKPAEPAKPATAASEEDEGDESDE